MSKLSDADKDLFYEHTNPFNANPDALIEHVETILAALKAERDIYRRARQENDERLHQKVQEQRERAEKAEAERNQYKALLGDAMGEARKAYERAKKAEAERDLLAAAVERVRALMAGPEWHIEVALGGSHYVNDQLRTALSDAGRGK